MAEWLGRLTRNQMGSSRASSDLADCVVFLSEHKKMQMFKIIELLGVITAVRTEQSWPSG